MTEITRDNTFTVTKVENGDYIKVKHCKTFNVTVFGLGCHAKIEDRNEFDSIEKLDSYIEMLESASAELKRL